MENDNHINTHDDIGGNGKDEIKKIVNLSGMYEDWFLDYASYVILERAVPHIMDGLKPVQRRILHAMRRVDDGRYNKVANIIGYSMQYHPHGDASIGEALIQLGQKDLLVDTQGNWGNQLTGDSAAAPRYIEARLSKFAHEVLFNPKTTEWKPSYDGRNKEPITLPAKFPVLLAQGVEGIAVGLASKILPHNFNELIDASIRHLEGKPFEMYPDFPTGGLADSSRYNDGMRGGVVKIRAKINKVDKKTLSITEIPFGRTTTSIIESIIKANDKGKIKVKKIDDNTAEHVEILIHLVSNGITIDQTIDALYAFTDCEISISPNSCVVENGRPKFIGVSNILKHTVSNTVDLLTRELQIRRDELVEDWHMSSLEKIFIENKIYNDIEDCETWESIITTIDEGLTPFKKRLKREVTRDDITKLTEIRIKRISKYDAKKADEYIKGLEDELEEVNNHLNNIIPYVINYYRQIKKKYGKGRERKTEIRNFENIQATHVVVANEKLYVNRKEGFIGTSLKKDEYVCDCSDIDDVIVFREDGTYLITKVSEKSFIGKNIIYANVFKKNDKHTVFNIIYRDGQSGNTLVKRCSITGLTRDKEYNITRGTEHSKVLYMAAHPNGETEVLDIYLKPKPRLKKVRFEFDFKDIGIKGRTAMGNILTRHAIHKLKLKEIGDSTLGGKKLWFDEEVLRLNHDDKGKYLGEFQPDDKLLIFYKNGAYQISPVDLSLHFEDDIILIEKYVPEKHYTLVYFEGEQGYYYIKRFSLDDSQQEDNYISDHPKSKLVYLSDDAFPRYEVIFDPTRHQKKENEVIDAAGFIGIKSVKARGKRISSYHVKKIKALEPLVKEEPENNDEIPGDKKNSESQSFPGFNL